MSNLNNRNAKIVTTTTFKQDQVPSKNVKKSTIRYNQAPTPEPRRKLSHQLPLVINENEIATPVRTTADNVNDQKQQVSKLVISNLRQQKPIYNEIQKRTSFNDTPVEYIADEGVCSPMNTDYDEEEEIADEYYEDEEEYDTADQADELAHLSRQSGVSLDDLIAYYKCILQENIQVQKQPASRQSSCISQKTIESQQSSSEDTVDNIIACEHEPNACFDQESTEEANESSVKAIQIPQVQIENVPSNEEEIEGENEQQINLPPLKDKRRIRANVVLELINSERDFVKHLKDVVEGYLYPSRRHPEIFTAERINTIFSNIEQLYNFQRKFLDSLESCINWDDLASSEVGQCFLKYEKGFSVYHHYCNNHPNATSELQDLYTKQGFVKFFEACRLLQNMIDISLDGFLLTPIQKICKYPLQLNELLKNTDEDHPDFCHVSNALESMRNCANLANERKRRIEALADVMSFQEKVENWFGPKLSDTSSILIHSGEVSKMASHTWSQGVQLYLFDHLLLYSKKDLLKRNSLILKGRICMDFVTEISDAEEYKSKKSFKLYCSEHQKWFVFTTRSEKEKVEWIRAFERERNLVEADENDGFQITDREIGIARRALQNRKYSRSARYRHKRPDTAIVDQLDLDDANTIMNRTLSLPSCIHPSHVMNFVEDSRVITTHKKNTSPNSNSRSPNSSSQYLSEQESQQQQQSSGGWFKKMGSKKLAKSQLYNVNGTSGSSSSKSYPVSPISGITNDSTVTPVAITTTTNANSATKYDQLEKRHRDHMISEEQARLFRLNNDLPPAFAATTTTSTTTKSSAQLNRNETPHSQQRQSKDSSTTKQLQPPESGQLSKSFNNSLNLNRDNSAPSLSKSEVNESSTFEATLVLSSGRVVRVREDAV